jgi:phosphotransferase system HPr-like phosphotransfer protein
MEEWIILFAISQFNLHKYLHSKSSQASRLQSMRLIMMLKIACGIRITFQGTFSEFPVIYTK